MALEKVAELSINKLDDRKIVTAILHENGYTVGQYGDTRQGLGNDGNSISLQQDCYECPTCGSFLGYVSDCEDEEYQDGCCRNCGQAILWEEELCQ